MCGQRGKGIPFPARQPCSRPSPGPPRASRCAGGKRSPGYRSNTSAPLECRCPCCGRRWLDGAHWDVGQWRGNLGGRRAGVGVTGAGDRRWTAQRVERCTTVTAPVPDYLLQCAIPACKSRCPARVVQPPRFATDASLFRPCPHMGRCFLTPPT